MEAVVITYPGHFHITALCLQSLRHFRTDIQTIYIICDDLSDCIWDNYLQDCETYYKKITYNLKILPASILPGINKCQHGWWRQQLVKLNLDQIVPGDNWFVTDGDIVFDDPINIRWITPIHVRESAEDPISIMVKKYVDKMLGSSIPHLSGSNGRYALTSSIPFRHLEANILKDLRIHVSDQLGEDFIAAHIRMFETGEIVAYEPEAKLMVMHEWELIEAYNQLCYPDKFSIVEVGSGYNLYTHTNMLQPPYRYRVNHQVDSQNGREWFERQNLLIQDFYWQKANLLRKTF